jgi:hypothetical protein
MSSRGLAGWVLAIALLAAAAPRAAAGVSVGLIPNALEVAPGATFDVEIFLTEAGTPVNGFDAVIGYDPAALTLVPLDPLWHQEGPLLLSACGNTFHRFTQATGEGRITDVLLCNGIALSGPGPIYRLRFQASNTPQFTNIVFLPGLQFYNEGLFVTPVTSANSVIGIGMTPVGVEAGPPASLRLRVAPNPSARGTVFTIEAARAGMQRIRVLDARGRVVWRGADSLAAAGSRRVTWDGSGDDGRRLAAGTYLVVVDANGRSVSERVSLVR